MRRYWRITCVGVLLAASALARAQTPPPGAAVAEPTDAVAERLGRRLRCPVCQGLAIGDSPAPMAQDMMRQVRRLRHEAQSEQQIVDYFTARYGTWVLLDPPWRGFSLWVWVLPPTVLLGGAAWLWARVRRQATRTPPSYEPAAAAAPPLAEEWLKRVRREVEQE